MQFLVFLYLCFLAIATALNLPSYMKKCSAKDPQLERCLINHSNDAIPRIVKGDSSLGTPVLSPIKIPKLNLQGDNFKLSLTNVHFDDMKDFVMTDVTFDLEGSRIHFVLNSKYLNFTSNYEVDNSQVMSRPIFGSGRFKMVLVDNVMKYKTNIELHKRHGGTYIRRIDPKLMLDSQKAYFYFENIRSSNSQDRADTNIYLQEHSREIFDKIRPGIERVILNCIESVFSVVNEKIALEDALL